MPITKAAGWLTSDSQFFEKQEEAKDAEFKRQLTNFAEDQFWEGLDCVDNTKSVAGFIIKTLYENRLTLLPIFKELNGGNVITAPVKLGDITDEEIASQHK